MNDLWPLITGALLALIGGGLNDEWRSKRERDRERSSIKISICDELDMIKTTLSNMNEVWRQSHTLYPKYVDDLMSNTAAFDSLRIRLFLIDEDETRKKIIAFYKKLKDICKDSEGKLGTLADSDTARAEQNTFATNFQSLSTDAEEIRRLL